MTGSNSSVHGENILRDNVPVTRAELDAEFDARLDAALQRFFGGRIPKAGNGAQHQPCPAASQVADNDGLNGGHERAAGARVNDEDAVGADRWRGKFATPHVGVRHGEGAHGRGHGPGGLLLATGGVLHMILITYIMMSF
jgi:hypothetical protein